MAAAAAAGRLPLIGNPFRMSRRESVTKRSTSASSLDSIGAEAVARNEDPMSVRDRFPVRPKLIGPIRQDAVTAAMRIASGWNPDRAQAESPEASAAGPGPESRKTRATARAES